MTTAKHNPFAGAPYICGDCRGQIPKLEAHLAMPNVVNRKEVGPVYRQHIVCAELKDHLTRHYKDLGAQGRGQLLLQWQAVKQSLEAVDGGVKDKVYYHAKGLARLIRQRLEADGLITTENDTW